MDGSIAGGIVTYSVDGTQYLNPTGAMPKLHPTPLDDDEVTAVATYALTLQSNRR